jgi:hypothetical protein
MSSTASARSGVDDLGPDALLHAPEDAEVRRRQAELDQLQLAYQWCVLHPATPDTGTAAWGGDGNVDAAESLGGDGTPLVAAFAPEPLGLALGVPTTTAMTLIADALDLVHRLPHTWRRAQTLDIPIWRARRVAQRTHAPSVKAAAHVDRVLAPRQSTLGVTLIDRTIATHMPEEHATREEQARQTWDVVLHHPHPTEYAGTSELHVVGDTMTLTTLYDRICATAAHLKTHGDQDPLGVRKVMALENLAGTPRTKLYLHLDADAPVGRAEKLGPATLAQIRDWVGHSRVTIQPILHTDRTDAVDAHDPPARMRNQVILRDPRCVFPHCQRDARSCDLDHTIPYDDTGPPAQTSPHNLAPLCRRHHRAKTTGRWQYRRQPDGTYQWTGRGIEPPG